MNTPSGKTHGLIVDYIGIFDNVANALNFDEAGMKKVITNIEEVKKQLPKLMGDCTDFFVSVNREQDDWEMLLEAQQCLPNNEVKDRFAAYFRVLTRAREAISPDPCLIEYRDEYKWLAKIYESVRPTDNRGALVWAAFGAKTMELVHENIIVGEADDTQEIITMDADLIDDFIKTQADLKKVTMKVEINLIAIIRKHSNDPKYIALGEKLERLREQHEQGLLGSIEFLKMLLTLAREAAQAEREVVPEQEIDKGKAALTELFNGVRNESTPIIVERIVNDIDGIVKIVRFDGWQDTTEGKKDVKKALRQVTWKKYGIKDQEVFDKAYSYIEEYY